MQSPASSLAPAPPEWEAPPEPLRGDRRKPAAGRRPLRRRIGGASLWVLLVLGFLVIGAYAALAIGAGDKVPAGASVAGVPIGGLGATAAENKLERVLGARADQPIVVTGAKQTAKFTGAQAGLRLDARQSVLDAGGGSSYWPKRIWRYYTGKGADRDAAATTSDTKLDLAVAGVRKIIGKQVVDGAIRFDRGQAFTRPAADGRKVEKGDAEDALRKGFLRTDPVAVQWSVVEPQISDEAVKQAMKDFATPATSGPVDLRLDKSTVVAEPVRYTQAIRMVADGDELKPRLDVDGLLAALEPVMGEVAGVAQPARIVIEDGKPVVVPSKKGISFDRQELKDEFLDAVVKAKGQRELTVKGVTAAPSFTTADARRMKITQEVATSTTPFGFAEYRNVNIARAAELLDGVIVQPDQTFSMELSVGEPTESRGFMRGFEIEGGVFKPDAGAGLSQVSSTLFNAMYEAGLEDVDHTVPAVYAGRYPLGREATYEYGQADLRFTNNTPYGVLITASSSPSSTSGDGSLTVGLWSTRTWDVEIQTSKRYDRREPAVKRGKGATCAARVGFPGFSVDVTRVFRKPGQKAVDHRQKATTVYKPTSSQICDP